VRADPRGGGRLADQPVLQEIGEAFFQRGADRVRVAVVACSQRRRDSFVRRTSLDLSPDVDGGTTKTEIETGFGVDDDHFVVEFLAMHIPRSDAKRLVLAHARGFPLQFQIPVFVRMRSYSCREAFATSLQRLHLLRAAPAACSYPTIPGSAWALCGNSSATGGSTCASGRVEVLNVVAAPVTLFARRLSAELRDILQAIFETEGIMPRFADAWRNMPLGGFSPRWTVDRFLSGD
jgi:hypothetical protein